MYIQRSGNYQQMLKKGIVEFTDDTTHLVQFEVLDFAQNKSTVFTYVFDYFCGWKNLATKISQLLGEVTIENQYLYWLLAHAKKTIILILFSLQKSYNLNNQSFVFLPSFATGFPVQIFELVTRRQRISSLTFHISCELVLLCLSEFGSLQLYAE